MNRKTIVLAMSVILAWFTVLPVLAQSGGGYDLTWSTMDGGGGASSALLPVRPPHGDDPFAATLVEAVLSAAAIELAPR